MGWLSTSCIVGLRGASKDAASGYPPAGAVRGGRLTHPPESLPPDPLRAPLSGSEPSRGPSTHREPPEPLRGATGALSGELDGIEPPA
jgi:hypothetical protein